MWQVVLVNHVLHLVREAECGEDDAHELVRSASATRRALLATLHVLPQSPRATWRPDRASRPRRLALETRTCSKAVHLPVHHQVHVHVYVYVARVLPLVGSRLTAVLMSSARCSYNCIRRSRSSHSALALVVCNVLRISLDRTSYVCRIISNF